MPPPSPSDPDGQATALSGLWLTLPCLSHGGREKKGTKGTEEFENHLKKKNLPRGKSHFLSFIFLFYFNNTVLVQKNINIFLPQTVL